MSTKAQIKANQQNAQKSTGPQTDEGKAYLQIKGQAEAPLNSRLRMEVSRNV